MENGLKEQLFQCNIQLKENCLQKLIVLLIHTFGRVYQVQQRNRSKNASIRLNKFVK